jgi:hypothetical protein
MLVRPDLALWRALSAWFHIIANLPMLHLVKKFALVTRLIDMTHRRIGH